MVSEICQDLQGVACMAWIECRPSEIWRELLPRSRIHSPIVHPCRGLLLLQIHGFEVDVMVMMWDDERVIELIFGVGS